MSDRKAGSRRVAIMPRDRQRGGFITVAHTCEEAPGGLSHREMWMRDPEGRSEVWSREGRKFLVDDGAYRWDRYVCLGLTHDDQCDAEAWVRATTLHEMTFDLISGTEQPLQAAARARESEQ